jgi:hypothetical protein
VVVTHPVEGRPRIRVARFGVAAVPVVHRNLRVVPVAVLGSPANPVVPLGQVVRDRREG